MSSAVEAEFLPVNSKGPYLRRDKKPSTSRFYVLVNKFPICECKLLVSSKHVPTRPQNRV